MGALPSTALVDESFRRDSVGEGFFLLSAVVAADHHHALLQQRLRALVAPGQRRWHFRAESPASRRKFLSMVAELQNFGLRAVTFCCATPSPRKSEQARVLRDRGVRTVVLESRQEHNDRKDRREILAALRAGVATPGLVYRHGRPKEEPLLWLPDAVVGAVGMSIADNQHDLFELLPGPLRTCRWIGR